MDPESDTGACARDATRDTGAARTPTAGMPRDMENAAIVLCFTLVAKATARRKVMNDCAGEGGVDALFFCVSPPFSLEAEEKKPLMRNQKKRGQNIRIRIRIACGDVADPFLLLFL